MIKHIRKVGDSLGVTLPTREVKRVLGVGEGTPVRVTIENGEIRIAPLNRLPQPDMVARRARKMIRAHAKTIDLLAQK